MKSLSRYIFSICICLFLILESIAADVQKYAFEHISVEDGLSQSVVFSIYKDQKDFLWLGTRRGMNRYDGVNITHFLHDPDNPNSLIDNTIIHIIGDSKDNLIIQTREGINYYDKYKEEFRVVNGPKRLLDFTRDWNNRVWASSSEGLFLFDENLCAFNKVDNTDLINIFRLATDLNNNLWLTNGAGAIRYNLKTQETRQFKIEHDLEGAKGYFYIRPDENGKIWICSRNGLLFSFDEQTEQIVFEMEIKVQEGLIVTNFAKGLENNMIISTDGAGLLLFDISSKSVTQMNHEPDVPSSLSSNTIYSIYADQHLGILWLGSYMGGVNYTFKHRKAFSFEYHQPYNDQSVLNNNIRSLMVDSDENLWLGTRQGVTVKDRSGKLIRQITSEHLLTRGITNSVITNVYEDPNGYVWICSYKGGILLFDKNSSKLKDVKSVYPKIDIPEDFGVFDVMMDNHQNVWIASENGTYYFPYNKTGFKFDGHFSKKLLQDRAGRIFVGTSYDGLWQVEPQSLKLSRIKMPEGHEFNQVNRINTLYDNGDGSIWIGTGGNGVYKYSPTSGEMKHFGLRDGLPDDNVAGIVMDPNGNFWVTTYTGLCRFSRESSLFKYVYLEKQTKGKEFNPSSIAMSPSGTLYAGSVNGLLTLKSDQYRENPYLPKVVFTELFVNSKKVNVQTGNAISRSIMFADKVNLNHDENTLRINFSAPTFYYGEQVTFSYALGEESSDWIDIGTDRTINFVNLKPGKYQLRVKASNSDGHSTNESTNLLIAVAPPIWQTNSAYVAYFIFAVIIGLLIRREVRSRLKLRYQIFTEQSERQKQEEMNQSRVRLFTDVSHEIGTSLTLINVPLDTLIKIESDDLKQHQLNIINNNVNRLKQLVKRIIGLRRVETGNVPLRAEEGDIVAFVRTICENYRPLSSRNAVSFIEDIPDEPLETWFDKDKVEYIVYNLLSNAFKFEPEDGVIDISLKKEKTLINGTKKVAVIIRVTNQRSVIPQDKANLIFNRFQKVEEGSYGAGIGLSLVQSLVQLHKGEIELKVGEEQGVTFEVRLPHGVSYLSEDEKVANTDYKMKTPEFLEAEQIESSTLSRDSDEQEIGKVLIAEDNIELRNLLKEQLLRKYEVIEAHDGEDALIKVRNMLPDLVLTDWVMPNMGGLELCQKIKSDLDIGHIPVVILTARNDTEDQIKAMEAGADAFIQKPFQMNYLSSVIFNQIELRKKLRKKFRPVEEMDDGMELQSIDENFLEKAHRILDANLENRQFGIPNFAEELGVTKYMLYTKLKEITGHTPNDYLIVFKLKRAAHILKTKDVKDVDLYHKVGFNDVSYFRKCFKKHFGVTPNQFVKSNKFNDQSPSNGV